MKEINFNLKLTFSDDVSVADLETIMHNTISAIINEANNGEGISPDDTEYITKSVEMSHILCAKPVKKDIY